MGRGAKALLVLLAVALVFVGIGVLVRSGPGFLPNQQVCTAEVGDASVTLTPDQAENAALIAAISVRRGLPPRAASIALATAYQESKIENIDYGDRDSLGLFQQRPSQGWGTREQILDPIQATNAFYDALVQVNGYQSMEITEAAQEVQRSGFPGAYADHEADARVLASALTGQTRPGAFSCVVRHSGEVGNQQPGPAGLTPDAARVREELQAAFGEQSLGGFAPEGVTTGHQRGSAHYEGRAIDVFVRPIGPTNKQRGWAMAAWATANADRLNIQTVIFDARIWTASRSDQGWRDYEVSQSRSGNRQILLHRDHVHIDVRDG